MLQQGESTQSNSMSNSEYINDNNQESDSQEICMIKYPHPEKDVEAAVINKGRTNFSSGYLDDQYQITQEFRQVEDYHFRIQDADEILNLQKLHKNSVPIYSGFQVPTSASASFNSKMNSLIGMLDSLPKANNNTMEAEIHGFYKMRDDQYDEKEAIETAYQSMQMNSMNNEMGKLSINHDKISFKSKKKQKPEEMEEEGKQKAVIKGIKKMRIIDEDQL